MSILKIVILYFSALVAFFAIDMLWLGVISKDFYARQLGHLLSPKVHWVPAIIFYLLFVAGILIFAVVPGVEAGSLARTALMAALFGLFCYATYDLSNLSTLKNWPLLVTVVDIVWGITISTSVAIIAYFIGRAII
ncbi:MAG: DUF2177 family protein [Dehalococcoidaceae bacterium]|nr:DUF2177 family protein [Dehalococcoidaceae bacterium]